ncbi:erythromycin esterase family protein [Lewinella sp. IMCC34191]|uniref:erythromycin esterase family protein n=1 Tax=Lewinella sp. IMCC34191 TaxID=2259172 RepID=UPI000E22B6DD|nr:erythromycin esterase family protein [Lewinella sp. IMCC34191]
MRNNQTIIAKGTIWLLLLTSLAACRTEAPFITNQSDLTGLNLGFEDTTAAGRPAEWFLAGQAGTVELTTEADYIHSGERAVLFVSDTSTDARINLVFNSVLTDVVSDRLTLTVKTKIVGEQAPQFGFYTRKITETSQGVAVLDTLSNQPVTTGWQLHQLSFSEAQLTGYILEFGFWVRGKGKLALDDFTVHVDGMDYAEALHRAIPAVPDTFMQQVKNDLIELPNGEPGNYPWLRSAVGDANIVLLGEGTHGTHEFLEQRLNITRFLIEELGFRVVALEANMPEADLLNANLASATRRDSLQALIDQLHFWMYRSEEYLDFFRWVQRYNSHHDHSVAIRGVDMQSAEVALNEIARYADDAHDPVLQRLVDSVTINVTRASLPVVAPAQRLVEYLREHNYGNGGEWLHQYALVALHALTLKGLPPGAKYRDEKMAEHAVWLAERAENERIVIWAHNGHIQLTHDAMGDWLSRGIYGNHLVSIGMTTGRGTYRAVDPWTWSMIDEELKPAPPETWEHYLQGMGIQALFLDLRPLRSALTTQSQRRMRTLGAIATPKQFFPADLGRSYDGLIYIDSTVAATPY